MVRPPAAAIRDLLGGSGARGLRENLRPPGARNGPKNQNKLILPVLGAVLGSTVRMANADPMIQKWQFLPKRSDPFPFPRLQRLPRFWARNGQKRGKWKSQNSSSGYLCSWFGLGSSSCVPWTNFFSVEYVACRPSSTAIRSKK